MNPVRGAGACCGIEDAITLVNVLKGVLRSDSNPSERDLRQAFIAYQGVRESSARLWMDISRLSLDLSTGPSQPALKATRIADMRTVSLVANGPILDDIVFPEKSGFIPWRKKPRRQRATTQVKSQL